MRNSKLTGSFVALITPMNSNGDIDYAGFETLIDFHARNGTNAVLIMGSTGEVSMLLPDERRKVTEHAGRMKRRDLEIWIGCTGPNTRETIRYCEIAADNGADGVIIAAPPYVCTSTDDIVAYVLEVADASSIPVGIYNNPPRVKTDLSHQDILRLARHPNIVINKESTSRVGQIAQTVAGAPDMSLMCCDSPNLGLVIPLMALGGDGTANMSGNVIPQEMATISTPWTGWEHAEACRRTWLTVLPLLHFVYSAVNPVALKPLMRALGLPAGPLRKPLTPVSDAELAAALDICRGLGLDERYGYALGPEPRSRVSRQGHSVSAQG